MHTLIDIPYIRVYDTFVEDFNKLVHQLNGERLENEKTWYYIFSCIISHVY